MKSMDDIDNLRELLVLYNKTLEKLMEAEREKTAALETGDIEKLNILINSEQALVMECSALEKRRTLICERLEIQSMSELYEKHPHSKEYIGSVHSEMLCNVNSLKKAGVLNNKLLDTRLSIIKLMNSQLGICAQNIQYDKNAGCVAKSIQNKAVYEKGSV
jgi:FlgN protein.